MNADKLKETLYLHRKWVHGEKGGERADLRGADLRGADLRGADLRGADLSGAVLSGAFGIKYAQCSFDAHGECGRMLTCIVIDGTPAYFCGCFRGTLDQLAEYIANGGEAYKESRTFAMEFVTKAAAMERKTT